MPITGLLLLLTILILSTGISLSNLYTVDRAQALESNCDRKILSLLPCPSGSDSEASAVIASARTVGEEKENVNTGIGIIDDTSGTSQAIAEKNDKNDDDDNSNANIESQIPSIISAIPFP
jgi:hypothetical protein